jgi:RND family efflux transporter MFP subunit
MNIRKKWLIGLVILVVAALAIGLVVKRNHELTAMKKPVVRPVPVQVVAVKEGTIAVTQHYNGRIDPVLSADLAARISASVLAVHKREGDIVAKGEVLVQLDDLALASRARGAAADARAAESLLAAAESNYQMQKASSGRDQYLYERKAVSREAYERAQALQDTAQGQMAAARERVALAWENQAAAATEQGYATILAPFAGIVVKRAVEPGGLAVPGKALLSLQSGDEGYRVVAQIPQEQVQVIRPATPVIVSGGGLRTEAKVNKVFPALGINSLATVEILLADTPFGLPPGATVGVDFVTAQVAGAVVPVQAVVQNTRGAFVVVVDGENIARQIPVEVVGQNDKQAAVRGIGPDVRVAVAQENVLMQLMDGVTVKAVVNEGDKQ